MGEYLQESQATAVKSPCRLTLYTYRYRCMCIYVYVCMYVCVYVGMYVCMCIYIYIYIYIYMYAYVINMFTYQVCMCVYVYTYLAELQTCCCTEGVRCIKKSWAGCGALWVRLLSPCGLFSRISWKRVVMSGRTCEVLQAPSLKKSILVRPASALCARIDSGNISWCKP